MTDVQSQTFKPPGPVTQAFSDCLSPVQFIMGPVGSAKTTTLINKCLMIACFVQKPSPLDNTRYCRLLAVRDTYRQLEQTTIPSWKEWTVNKGVAPEGFTGGRGGVPGNHLIKGPLPDGTKVHFEAKFIAIEDNTVEDVMRGFEFTILWMNEADLCSQAIYEYGATRYGRYPGKIHGGPTWCGILADYNAPDDDNWAYKLTEEDRPEEVAFFRQPGGLEPDAENLENLPGGRDYYQRQVKLLSKKPWLIDRMVHNKYAQTRDGKPIYTMFDDRVHVSTVPLEPIEGVPLLVGLDQGLRPAALIMQEAINGQVRVLRELYGDGITATAFGEQLGRLLGKDYPGYEAVGVADPHSVYAAAEAKDPWIDQVSNAADIRIEPALTNAIGPRIDAMQTLFQERIDADTPRLIIDPSCKVFRKACNSKYHYRKLKVNRQSDEETFAEEPNKNHPWSDLADAGQYAAMDILGERGLRGFTAAKGKSNTPHGQRIVETQVYDPFDYA